MDQNQAQQALTEAARENPASLPQHSLNHIAHKIAWTRMNGKNDSMNPYCEASPSGERTGRRAPS